MTNANCRSRRTVAALSLIAMLIPFRARTQQLDTHVIYFNSGVHALSPAGLAQVQAAARLVSNKPQARLICIGHADRVGSNLDNNILSIRRAGVVKLALMSEGVAEESILVIGKGSSETVTPPWSLAEQARDRRVEIKVQQDK